MSLSEMLGELEKRITAFFAGLTGQENTNTAHTLPHKESPPWLSDDLNKIFAKTYVRLVRIPL